MVEFGLNSNPARAGGMWSSTKDLTTLGKSILRSEILNPTTTRRWMKPVTHTSYVYQSVGMVWEIVRLNIPVAANSKATRVVDLYTKNGELGAYDSILVLDPEHDIGFSILTTGEHGANQVVVLSELIANTWIPALEDAAREHAQSNLIGTYESTDPKLNSSITFSLSPARGGLGISAWTSNSTDLLAALTGLLVPSKSQSLSISLYSTGLQTSKQSAFRAMFEALPFQVAGKSFSENCASWAMVDRFDYGNIGLDDFVFELDASTGKATAMSPRSLRTTLKRKA
jgi:hypothetical protein